jgi:hypothetical protein
MLSVKGIVVPAVNEELHHGEVCSKGKHEKLNQHSQDLGHDLNLGPPKCETRTLIIHLNILRTHETLICLLLQNVS